MRFSRANGKVAIPRESPRPTMANALPLPAPKNRVAETPPICVIRPCPEKRRNKTPTKSTGTDVAKDVVSIDIAISVPTRMLQIRRLTRSTIGPKIGKRPALINVAIEYSKPNPPAPRSNAAENAGPNKANENDWPGLEKNM